MSDRIDISKHVEALCRDLNLGPKENVAEIVLLPSKVTATVYKVNENGSKYIVPDEGIAQSEVVIEVTT